MSVKGVRFFIHWLLCSKTLSNSDGEEFDTVCSQVLPQCKEELG